MEQHTWDILITGTVIGALILIVWSKTSGMTVVELIKHIKETFSDKTEELTPEAMVWNE